MREHVVVFQLGREKYAVPIGQVKEIIVYKSPTALPDMANFFEGIIDLRGAVIPVINLAARFNIVADKGQGIKGQIIVVEINEHIVGLVVEEVTAVVNLAADAIHPAPALVSTINEYIYGVAQYDENLLILLDIAKVLCEDQLADLRQAG